MPHRSAAREFGDQYDVMRGRLQELIDDRLVIWDAAARACREDRIEDIQFVEKQLGELQRLVGGLITLRQSMMMVTHLAKKVEHPEARKVLV